MDEAGERDHAVAGSGGYLAAERSGRGAGLADPDRGADDAEAKRDRGEAKMARRLRDQTSSKKAMVTPCMTRDRKSHSRTAPSMAGTKSKPGEAMALKVRLFDNLGRLIREEPNALWSLEGMKGKFAGNLFTPAVDGGVQAGKLKATVGGISGVTNVRVIPSLPLSDDFSGYAVEAIPSSWINATPKYAVRELEGNKVLLKKSDNPAFQRARTFVGPANWSDYTVEADVRAVEKRRQLGDAGVRAFTQIGQAAANTNLQQLPVSLNAVSQAASRVVTAADQASNSIRGVGVAGTQAAGGLQQPLDPPRVAFIPAEAVATSAT
jgi:hypothetical protein